MIGGSDLEAKQAARIDQLMIKKAQLKFKILDMRSEIGSWREAVEDY